MNLRALVVAVCLGAGVFVFTPAPTASASPCAAAAPASVAVVVDFGDGSPVSAVCVPAGSSDNGAVVLAARAQQLGTPAPRFDSSGFVCGIDGYPTSGCGEQNGSTYAYWSYWHGSADGGWSYSNVGPGGSRVHGDVVEGWRFQPQGAGNPSDPPPNGNPDHNATCAPTNATTTTAAPAPDQADPSPTTAAVVVAPSVTSDPSTSTTGTTTTTVASSTTSTTHVVATSQVAAAAPHPSLPGQHRSPWPAIGAGAVIVGLIGGGVYAARRRASP